MPKTKLKRFALGIILIVELHYKIAIQKLIAPYDIALSLGVSNGKKG